MTLGELISTLKRKDLNAEVWYDFGYFRPRHLQSWRGDYSQLSLGYCNESGYKITVSDLLLMLQGAVGKEFVGYKGGEYVMDLETEVWVANSGEACHTEIRDVIEDGSFIILATEYRP